MVKKINGRGITVKVFTSGKIDVLGSKNIVTNKNDIR